jgi:hypothetical protein
MKLLHRIAALLGFVALPLAVSAAQPAEPGPVLVPGQTDAAWKTLFAHLTPRGTVLSRFTEYRTFPFRQQPVTLEGEMRLDPQHGLSLHYTSPEVRTVVIDRQGMIVRDADGRVRAMPADPRATALNAALLPILQFDEPEILRQFTIQAARDGDDWRLDFVPHDASLARTLGQLTTWGHGDALQRLEFRRSRNQRVDIVIESAERGVTFTAADFARYFR